MSRTAHHVPPRRRDSRKHYEEISTWEHVPHVYPWTWKKFGLPYYWHTIWDLRYPEPASSTGKPRPQKIAHSMVSYDLMGRTLNRKHFQVDDAIHEAQRRAAWRSWRDEALKEARAGSILDEAPLNPRRRHTWACMD